MIWTIFLFLSSVSVVEVYSSTVALISDYDYLGSVFRHMIFLLIGWVLVLIIHSINPKYFKLFGLILPIAFVMLLIPRFMNNYINSSYRWISIVGISFQPSEFAKLSLITFISFLLSKRNDNNENKIFYLILISATIVCVTIFIDNASTAIILFIVVYLMMFIGQISVRRLLIFGSLIICFLVIVFYNIMYTNDNFLVKISPRITTWKARFMSFKKKNNVNNLNFSITGDNYQTVHSNIAIINGSFFGRGIGNSLEKSILPQSFSDFIYSIIIEESGLVGGFIVIFSYIVFFVRSGLIANQSNNFFCKFIVIGVALLIVIQALVNMAVAVNLIPVTGQTLPLISRGGTSTLVNCIYFGIVLSVSHYSQNPSLSNKFN